MDKLRIGLIGCGEIARNAHLPGWAQATNGRIVAICDIDGTRAGEQAAKYGIQDVYTDYRDLLDRKDIDAVDICLPHALHGPVGIEAANAGKHVLVEKPITTTLEQAVALIDACERAGVKLMVDHISRFSPPITFMKQVIDSGAVGQITYVGSRRFHLKNIIAQAETKNQSWKLSREDAGGGAIHRDGIHTIDVVRWFSGSEVERIYAEIDNFLWEQEVESCGHTLLRFRNRAIGEMVMNWCTVHPGFGELTVAGTVGTVRTLGRRSDEVEIYSEQLGVRNSELHALLDDLYNRSTGYSKLRPEALTVQVPSGRDPRTLLGEHFVDCILNDREPLTSGLESAKALEIIIGAYRAAEKRAAVSLPLFPLDRLYERPKK